MTESLTRRQLAKAATRAKVLSAAKLLFEIDGYERATIRDIARVAEMSTGAVFASFAGKAELYATIYGRPPISPEVGAELLRTLREIAAGNFDCAYHQRFMAAQGRAEAAIVRATNPEATQDAEAAAAMRGAA